MKTQNKTRFLNTSAVTGTCVQYSGKLAPATSKLAPSLLPWAIYWGAEHLPWEHSYA